MSRTEVLARVGQAVWDELAFGVYQQVLATGSLRAQGLTTSLVRIHSNGELAYHAHPFSEVLVVLEGEAIIAVDGRGYQLTPFDAFHIPARTPHMASSARAGESTLLHVSHATERPTSELATLDASPTLRDKPGSGCPETLTRFVEAPIYELAANARFRDLFARRFGARGICGGYGLFAPGASLPCHYHGFDESITIVAGTAVCQVSGREYSLSDYDTACIPRGRPHRFLNRSDRDMAMIWVYAGDEPDRTVVDASCCDDLVS